MWQIKSKYETDHFYDDLYKEILSLIPVENDSSLSHVMNVYGHLAQVSSWIFHSLPEVHWCGFYLWSPTEKELILGPYQGRPACLKIHPERGVCGKAFREKRSLNISNVHDFPGHIACDHLTLSELVIPLKCEEKKFGVLDLDSYQENRFSNRDLEELTRIMDQVTKTLFRGSDFLFQ